MLKLVLVQPGQPDLEHLIAADVATVGRAPTCDVVVDQPFVSKQHLRVFRGTVVVDLGSSNGTYLGGKRLTEATLFVGERVVLGQSDLELRIVVNDPTAASGVATKAVAAMRLRCEELEAEVARLSALPGPGELVEDLDPALARLRGENESLRQRIESLREEFQEREVDDGSSVQARLAMQRLESVQSANERLASEVERLKGLLTERDIEIEVRAEQSAPVGVDELFELRAELERVESELAEERAGVRQLNDQSKLVAELRREVESLKSAARQKMVDVDPQALVAAGKKEIAALRTQVAELEGRLAAAPSAPRENASDLFFKLQAENVEMRRKVAALEAAGPSVGGAGDASGKRDVKALRELMEARLRITALESEVGNLRRAAPAGAPALVAAPRSTPRAVPAAPIAVVPAVTPAAGTTSANPMRELLQLFAEKDADALPKGTTRAPEEFVLIESVRLLRHVERVVTRIAGDLIQLFQLKTMLPDTSGTYRDLVGDTFSRPDDRATRERLVTYLETLGRWLVAAIGAHRRAAVLVVQQLKDDLSEEALLAKDPLPAFAKIPVLAKNELWTRVCQYLQALSPDAIDERVDVIAREQAQKIVNGEDSRS